MGLGDALTVVFLRTRFGVSEGAGDSASEADVALSAGEAVAAAFLGRRCFAGEENSLGVPVRSCE